MNKQEFLDLEKKLNDNEIFLMSNGTIAGYIIKRENIPEPKRFRTLVNKKGDSTFTNSQIEIIKQYGGRYISNFSTWYLTTD